MYNIEQVKILIPYKERQLRELRNDPSSSQIEIKKVEDELKSLEIYSIRYEIAKIIGYENNDSFKNVNYIGIENEDFSKMNLTQEQLDSLNQLISKLPAYNAELFKTRLEMAKMLKLENDKALQAVNYEGIENNNPTSMQYRLSVNEVAKFNSLRNRVTILRQSNNFQNKNLNDIAKEAVEKLIKKLNEMDLDDYQANSEEDLETLFKLLDLVQGEKNFPEIKNYEFAHDISKKYPSIQVKITQDQILELIELLDKDKDIEKEKYNEYLKLLADNIRGLLKEEQITDETKAIIDRINKSNYSLRIDLNNLIENDLIKFKDNDIESLVKYLDTNYDKLDEAVRDKLFNFLTARIKKDLTDVNNADRINKLIDSVKNKEFREKLRSSLKKTDNVIFSDQHVNSYSNLIEEKIKKLEAKRQKYLGKKTGIEALDIMYKTKAKEIEKEIERLRQINLSYDDSTVISQLDEQYNSRQAKIIKIQKEIQELQKIKEDLKTEFQKRRVDKQIKKLQDKIKKLKTSQVRIEGIQKKIMTPKMFVEMKRGMISRHFESKSEIYTDYADDYEKMAEKQREMGGMFSGIKAAFYEFKAGRYRSKAEMNQAIFAILSKPGTKIQVTGSTKKVIPKQQVQALRQQMNDQQQMQQQAAA